MYRTVNNNNNKVFVTNDSLYVLKLESDRLKNLHGHFSHLIKNVLFLFYIYLEAQL
jgi:hypothetical protein